MRFNALRLAAFSPAVLIAALLVVACDPPPPAIDGGMDAGSDAGFDAGSDAGPDAGSDAGPDAGPDAGHDAGPDAGSDAATRVGSLGFETIAVTEGAGAFTAVVAVPGTTDELFVARHEGTVVHYRVDGSSATLLGEFVVPSVVQMVDCGLISLSADPNFEDNGFLWAGHCSGEGEFDTRITRLHFDGDHSMVAASAVVIIDVSSTALAAFNHNVGRIIFEEGGEMLVGIGDKGRGPHAPDLNVLPGSILRIMPSRVAGVGGYTMPADNPSLGGEPEIYAYGLRYPWGLSRDGAGRVWIGEVGEGAFEELNILEEGGNYGWNLCEGACDPSMTDVIDPRSGWDRSNGHEFVIDDAEADVTARRTIWLGPNYDGSNDRYDGLLTGQTLFGDTCVGFVRGGEVGVDGAITSRPLGHLSHAVSWTELDGWLYAVTFGSCDSTQPLDPPTLVRAVPVAE